MFRDSKPSIWRSADCWRMRFPHHPAQEVRVCSTEVWVIHSLLQHSVEYLISALLGMRSICTGCPSLFVLPSYLLCICDLRRVFALSTAHTQFHPVCLTAQRVSSASAYFPHCRVCDSCHHCPFSKSEAHCFFNGFLDELGHFSQEAGVGPYTCLFTLSSLCTVRRATSDDFLPITLRVRPIIPEHYLTVWPL